MKNATGSKSVSTNKTTKPPAKGRKPEVKLDATTTVVLPNPADAPPPKAKGKKKPAPTVATRPGAAQAAEVPDWAKRAAARDTAAEMAAVPEAAPATEATRASDAPPAKPRAAKAPKMPSKPDAPVAPGTLRAVGSAWIESLRSAGHSVSTVSSYTNDLEVAHEFFGEVEAADLTEAKITAFNESDGVMKKASGKPKAQPTILKTRRALRLALVWAAQTGLIKKAPFAAKTPA